MKTIAHILIALLVAGSISAQSKHFTLAEITGGAFAQSGVSEMRPDDDGEHYTSLNKEHNMIIRYSYRTGNAVDTLFSTGKARECTFKNIDGYIINSTGHHILVWRETERIYRRSFEAVYYDYDVRRNYIKPLHDGKEKQMIPTFSPDGHICAFVVNNNIWLRKFDYDTEIQITKDGEANKILNGTTDWVYEEEFSVTNLMAWTADNACLVFVRTDESVIPDFSMQLYGNGLYPGQYLYKYPLAGQKNSRVQLMSYTVEGKNTKVLKLPIDEESYIPRIMTNNNAGEVAAVPLNRHQNRLQLYDVNARSGMSKMIMQDENDAYINESSIHSVKYYPTCFTYVSEKDGYSHAYLYSLTGVLQKQLTKGNWDMTNLLGYDELTKTVYFESAEDGPLYRSIWKIDAKGVKTCLTKEQGTNNAFFSKNFAYYINSYQNASTPTKTSVYETKSNKLLRVIEDNSALKEKLSGYDVAKKEFIKLHTASDFELNASILKPTNFDASKKYPVLMVQYSGPGSQSVLDNFSIGWEQYLAEQGIIVVSVDGRGTGARGEKFRKCTYLKMGLLESQDQAEAAEALGKLPYIDGKRIAIWGWSFGGYTTLMSMSVGHGAFKCGIAVAPPTDWKYYDSVYTERFMRTPQENYQGYAETSPLRRVADLQGKLLIIHGTADDNVHFMQTLEYTEALTQAGKQFRMQIYKDRNHNISGGNTRMHLYTLMSQFLFENL